MASNNSKSYDWQKTYQKLKEYITTNPSIRIEQDSIIIPEDVRSKFYSLFNETRILSIDNAFPSLYVKAQAISTDYVKVKDDLNKMLGVEEITMRPNLQRFLQNPKGELATKLFSSLFNLLKGKINEKAYEEEVYKIALPYFSTLYRDSYEKWVILSLIKMLSADKLLQANCRDYCSPEEAVRAKKSHPSEAIPAPKESKSILFHYDNVSPLMMADIIIYSAKTNKYISTRSHFNPPYNTAIGSSTKREWYSYENVLCWNDGITLLYTDNDPYDISLVAHAGGVCRPDMLIACETQARWFESDRLNQINAYHYSFKPLFGTHIISKEPVPEQLSAQLEEGVYIVNADLNADNLLPVIDMFANGSYR